MRRFGGRIGLGEHHDTLSDFLPKWGDARRSRLVAQQTVVTSLHEAFLPAPHVSICRFVHDLIGTDAVRAQQDNLSPPDVLMRRITIPSERGQAAAVSGLERSKFPFASGRLARNEPAGNPCWNSNVRVDPLGLHGKPPPPQGGHQQSLTRRLEAAKKMISAGKFPLSEIAFRSGFSSQAIFMGAFRRVTNMTLGEFRQHAR
jgi:hypothetical protein